MAIEVRLRDDRCDRAPQGVDRFVLRKAGREATCQMWSHTFGWELRLEVGGDDLRTRVCRTKAEVLDSVDAWKAVLAGTRWR